MLSTFTSNNGKHDYRTAGVLGMRQYLLTIARHKPLWKGFENATPGQIRDQFLATVGKAQPVKR